MDSNVEMLPCLKKKIDILSAALFDVLAGKMHLK